MKLLRIPCVLLVAATVVCAGVVNLSVEPMWASRNTFLRDKDNRSLWGFTGQYGFMPNEYISFGPSVTIAWNVEREREAVAQTSGTDEILSRESVIMIPLSVFFQIDPVPQYTVHPVAHLTLGYNSVWVINNVTDNSVKKEQKDEIKTYDGYYSGLYIKFGADAMIDFGKKISLFVGPQWQIATTYRRAKDPQFERKFNAFGLRFGVSALL